MSLFAIHNDASDLSLLHRRASPAHPNFIFMFRSNEAPLCIDLSSGVRTSTAFDMLSLRAMFAGSGGELSFSDLAFNAAPEALACAVSLMRLQTDEQALVLWRRVCDRGGESDNGCLFVPLGKRLFPPPARYDDSVLGFALSGDRLFVLLGKGLLPMRVCDDGAIEALGPFAAARPPLALRPGMPAAVLCSDGVFPTSSLLLLVANESTELSVRASHQVGWVQAMSLSPSGRFVACILAVGLQGDLCTPALCVLDLETGDVVQALHDVEAPHRPKGVTLSQLTWIDDARLIVLQTGAMTQSVVLVHVPTGRDSVIWSEDNRCLHIVGAVRREGGAAGRVVLSAQASNQYVAWAPKGVRQKLVVFTDDLGITVQEARACFRA